MLKALWLSLLIGCGGSQAGAIDPEPECQGGKVWHQDDALRFAGCEVIVGDLRLGGALVDASSFAGLQRVQGSVQIGPSYQLNNLASMSQLERIEGGLVVEGNWQLRGLFLGRLAYVAGGVRVSGNTQLQNLSLHGLVRLGGPLEVRDNPVLERIDLSLLREVPAGGHTSGKKLQEVLRPPGLSDEDIGLEKGQSEAVPGPALY